MKPDSLPWTFWSKVEVSGEHWLWLGAAQSRGYGSFGIDGKVHQAHRYSYEALVGPIPDGLVIDHLCRVRSCVNPAHMEPVTVEENNRRGRNYRGDFCINGHDLNEVGTYERKERNATECLACREAARDRQREKERGAKRICDACGKPRAHRARGLCTTCYARHRDAGTLPTKLRERTSA